MTRLILFCTGTLLVPVLVEAQTEAGRDRSTAVLILDSYHQGEAWSDGEVSGIRQVFSESAPHAALRIERLDAKTHPGLEHLSEFKAVLKQKYGHGDHWPRLIMALDNPALEFILKERRELFPGIPIVFAGINGYAPTMIAGQEGVTGVAEEQDMAGTLRLALSLHPGTRRILAVHDHTSSGEAVQRDMMTAVERVDAPVQVDYTPDMTLEELEDHLRSLPDDSLVVILSFVTDRLGRTYSRRESTERITSASRVPVYAMHETRMGFGIVGGLLLSGEEHGRQAAELGLRVLGGEDPAGIPVAHSRSHPMFDHRVLQRFAISESLLPAGSTVLFKPASFYQRYRWWIWGTLVFFTLESLLLFRLMVEGRRSRNAEAALRESEARHRLILENSSDIVWTMNGEGRFTYVSAALQRILGFAPESWVGRHPEPLVHPEELPLMEQGIKTLIEDRAELGGIDLRVRHADGSWRWCSTNAVPVLDERGELVSVVGVSRDISLQKGLEAERLELQRQLMQARKMESLGRMAGAIAHHFNNYLAAAQGNLEMALDDILEGRGGAAETIMEALKAGHSATRLTRMLTSSLGHSSGAKDVIDLSAFCQEAIRVLRLAMPAHLELKTDLETRELLVAAVPEQLHQVLVNLLTNAWEALGDGDGTVAVTLRLVEASKLDGFQWLPLQWKPSHAAYGCLSVSDNGSGISATDRDRIFDPFFTTKFTGRGLGLPVVLGSVTAMGGALSFESEPGSGTVFRVLLPLVAR